MMEILPCQGLGIILEECWKECKIQKRGRIITRKQHPPGIEGQLQVLTHNDCNSMSISHWLTRTQYMKGVYRRLVTYTETMKLEVHLFFVGGHSQMMVLKTRFEAHNPQSNNVLLRTAPIPGRLPELDSCYSIMTSLYHIYNFMIHHILQYTIC